MQDVNSTVIDEDVGTKTKNDTFTPVSQPIADTDVFSITSRLDWIISFAPGFFLDSLEIFLQKSPFSRRQDNNDKHETTLCPIPIHQTLTLLILLPASL
mmetsp:Transcript_4995/g.13960  ORF Transcript_4995/g.13960 Transcript_4995/m.13960 type:complete len:99 (-) Transcript_4995:65-361(-)